MAATGKVLRPSQSRCEDVARLQAAMLLCGYLTPAQLGAAEKNAGIYGPITQGSIRALQDAHGLRKDGIYGPATRVALTKELQRERVRALLRGVDAVAGVANPIYAWVRTALALWEEGKTAVETWVTELP